MKCSILLPAAWLAVAALASPTFAQARKDRSSSDLLKSLRSLQGALHESEEAELDLLAAKLRGAQVYSELQHLREAIERLRHARRTLSLRLSQPDVRQRTARNRPQPDRISQRDTVQPRGRDAKPAKRRWNAEAPPKRTRMSPAVALGLDWLRRHQDDDGKWDADGFMKHNTKGTPCDGAGNPTNDVGVTGLAMLAFLHSGSTLRSGPHKDNLKKAAAWLRKQQGKNGLYGTNASHDFIYDHAIATVAMCETYGRSNYKMLASTAQKGIHYLEHHRNPYAVWRYQPRDNDNDASVTSWCILAYTTAAKYGLEVNENALKIANNYLDKVTDEKTGMAGYTKKGERSSRHPGDHATRFPVFKGNAITAAALASRFALREDPKRKPIMKKSAKWILQTMPTTTDKGAVDHYFWFHGTRAMRGMGSLSWNRWRTALLKTAAKTQRQSGNAKGSWDPNGVWGEDGGRVYATALMTLAVTMAQ